MSGNWTFFTNHAHVLFCISEDPDIRLRDVAQRVGITERATQRIVAELEQCGYLRHEKHGRRNHYELLREARLRHPIEAHVEMGDLIDLLQPPPG
ncbi:MAG: winged helix-turn-helix domain-containing protein [Acidimicrobiia bacterium]|nr:winged helix-turn-helix domain-containing protein [Acidimicrobiia bacterium]